MPQPPRPARPLAILAAFLDSARGARMCMILAPVLFALMSLRLGQDDNWDLKNYHLYNPFAFLNGKIGFDLAPAQWQSYFNPTLDLLYYALNQGLPPPLVGVVMGMLHGLNFLLIAGIARQVLPRHDNGQGWRAPLLLALAGTLGPAFLTQLGNSMGDNMTSLFVLGSLLLLVTRWERLQGSLGGASASAAGAGLLMGLGTGLKLTNATYAVALCAALLSVRGAATFRLRAAFVFGLAVLIGIGLSAGHWFALMTQTFGNPLFPQFNDRFLAPLAAPIGIGDTGWLPKNLAEKLLWPLVFAQDSRRVGELTLRLWLWPVIYLSLLALALRSPWRRVGANGFSAPLMQRQRLLLLFFSLAYLVWLNLFGIYRYLVPLELLLPLVLWITFQRLLPAPWANRLVVALLVVGIAAGLPHASWGHARWTREAFTAQVPFFDQVDQSMVLTVHGDPPMGWLVTRFPARLAFVALGSGFPESPAFLGRVKAMVAARRGPIYVMLQGDRGARGAARSPAQLAEARAFNQTVLSRAQEVLGRYGFVLDAASCRQFAAQIGASPWDFQMCRVRAGALPPSAAPAKE